MNERLRPHYATPASANEGDSPLDPSGAPPADPTGGGGGVAEILSSLQAEFRQVHELLDAAQRTLDRGEDQVRRALGVALSLTGWRDTSSPQVDGLIIGFARIGGCRLAPVEMAAPSPLALSDAPSPDPHDAPAPATGTVHPAASSSLSPSPFPLLPSLSSAPPAPSTLHPAPSRRLLVHLLGPFVLETNDRRVERWQRGKAKSLCKFLVARRSQPVHREVLMEYLWPEVSPAIASGRLKVTVHALRQIVSPPLPTLGEGPGVRASGGRSRAAAEDCILFEDGFYRVNPRLDIWVDIEEFQRHWEAGRACERQGDPPGAVAEFEHAEALYRGDFLEEDLYEEWTQLQREYFKDLFLSVLGRLADNCLAETDYDACITRCHRILGRDSTQEAAYRRLMICHARMGHVGQALSWYRLCGEVLQRELDLAPGRETQDLHELLRAGRAI